MLFDFITPLVALTTILAALFYGEVPGAVFLTQKLISGAYNIGTQQVQSGFSQMAQVFAPEPVTSTRISKVYVTRTQTRKMYSPDITTTITVTASNNSPTSTPFTSPPLEQPALPQPSGVFLAIDRWLQKQNTLSLIIVLLLVLFVLTLSMHSLQSLMKSLLPKGPEKHQRVAKKPSIMAPKPVFDMNDLLPQQTEAPSPSNPPNSSPADYTAAKSFSSLDMSDQTLSYPSTRQACVPAPDSGAKSIAPVNDDYKVTNKFNKNTTRVKTNISNMVEACFPTRSPENGFEDALKAYHSEEIRQQARRLLEDREERTKAANKQYEIDLNERIEKRKLADVAKAKERERQAASKRKERQDQAASKGRKTTTKAMSKAKASAIEVAKPIVQEHDKPSEGQADETSREGTITNPPNPPSTIPQQADASMSSKQASGTSLESSNEVETSHPITSSTALQPANADTDAANASPTPPTPSLPLQRPSSTPQLPSPPPPPLKTPSPPQLPSPPSPQPKTPSPSLQRSSPPPAPRTRSPPQQPSSPPLQQPHLPPPPRTPSPPPHQPFLPPPPPPPQWPSALLQLPTPFPTQQPVLSTQQEASQQVSRSSPPPETASSSQASQNEQAESQQAASGPQQRIDDEDVAMGEDNTLHTTQSQPPPQPQLQVHLPADSATAYQSGGSVGDAMDFQHDGRSERDDTEMSGTAVETPSQQQAPPSSTVAGGDTVMEDAPAANQSMRQSFGALSVAQPATTPLPPPPPPPPAPTTASLIDRLRLNDLGPSGSRPAPRAGQPPIQSFGQNNLGRSGFPPAPRFGQTSMPGPSWGQQPPPTSSRRPGLSSLGASHIGPVYMPAPAVGPSIPPREPTPPPADDQLIAQPKAKSKADKTHLVRDFCRGVLPDTGRMDIAQRQQVLDMGLQGFLAQWPDSFLPRVVAEQRFKAAGSMQEARIRMRDRHGQGN